MTQPVTAILSRQGELAAKARQFNARRRRFFTGFRGLFRHITHTQGATADFIGNRTLLFGGGSAM